MANIFTQQMIAEGFNPKRIANDRRFVETSRSNQLKENALMEILRGEQIRGTRLDNTAKARAMATPKTIDPYKQAQIDNLRSQIDERKNKQPKLTELQQKIELAGGKPWAEMSREEKQSAFRSIGKKPDNKRFDNAAKLRGEITAATKDFKTIEGAYSRVQASATDPSAAGDLALIFNYMKVLDPGSTVREGEFATAQNAGGVDSKVAGLYNQVMNGKRLTEVQRADFLSRAGMLYKGQKEVADKRTNNIIKIGERFGIERADLITPDISDLSDADLDAMLAELE